MKRITVCMLLVLATAALKAQFISDVQSSRPFYQLPQGVQGNPFTNSNWSTGVIKTIRGVEHRDLRIKYDVYSRQLVFQADENMYQFTEPVKEFTLDAGPGGKQATFLKSSLVHNLLPGEFVQVLAAGKVNFYKHYRKIEVETAQYNAVSAKNLEDKNSFFVIRENTLTAVTFSKKQLETVLQDKWSQVAAFMDQNNHSAKNEAGWSAAIAFYNTL